MRDDAALEAFVVRNVDYYRRSWPGLRGPKRFLAGFNWAAAFGQIVWLLYRKLYGPLFWAVAVGAAHVALTLSTVFSDDPPFVAPELLSAWNLLVAALFYAVCGTFGNYWYWKKFSKTADLAAARTAEQASRLQFIRSRGGTNPVGVVLLVVVLLMPVLWAVYQASRVDVSGYVFDAEGPLTLAEVRANFLDRMEIPLDEAATECVFREVEQRARAAGDPQTLDPATVEFLPVETWQPLDRFGKRLLLTQAIVTKALFVCREHAASRDPTS